MRNPNPYESPVPAAADSAPAMAPAVGGVAETHTTGPVVSTADTIGPRYLAGFLDNVVAMALMLILAKQISDDLPALQVIVFVISYWLYFFLLEGLFGRTIGKLLMGLVVIQFNGQRCTWWQAFLRTLLRPLEVNPVLLGALPAAICVVFSKNRQRIGDKLAGTTVVKAWRLRSLRD